MNLPGFLNARLVRYGKLVLQFIGGVLRLPQDTHCCFPSWLTTTLALLPPSSQVRQIVLRSVRVAVVVVVAAADRVGVDSLPLNPSSLFLLRAESQHGVQLDDHEGPGQRGQVDARHPRRHRRLLQVQRRVEGGYTNLGECEGGKKEPSSTMVKYSTNTSTKLTV